MIRRICTALLVFLASAALVEASHFYIPRYHHFPRYTNFRTPHFGSYRGYYRGFRGLYRSPRYLPRPYYPTYPAYSSPACYGFNLRGPLTYSGGLYTEAYRLASVGGSLDAGERSVVRANYSDIIFNVQPPQALVYVDGKLIGSARSFATPQDRYTLTEGLYQIRIEHPHYQPYEATLELGPDRTVHLDIELSPLP